MYTPKWVCNDYADLTVIGSQRRIGEHTYNLHTEELATVPFGLCTHSQTSKQASVAPCMIIRIIALYQDRGLKAEIETLKIQGPSLHGRASIESVGRRRIFRALKSPQLACTFKQIRPGCVTFVFFLHPHFERSQLLAAGCRFGLVAQAWRFLHSHDPHRSCGMFKFLLLRALLKLSELCNMTQGRVRS